MAFAVLEQGYDESGNHFCNFVPGTMVDLRVPPFKGKVQLIQTCHPFEYERSLAVKKGESCPGTFVKYAVTVQMDELQVIEIFEIAVRTLTTKDLQVF